MLSKINITSQFEISLSDVTEILKFSREVITDSLESYHLIKPSKPNSNDGGTDFPFIRRMEKRLMNHIHDVSRKLNSLESNIQHKTDILLDNIVHQLSDRNKLDLLLQDLYKYIYQVDNLYLNFIRYSETTGNYENLNIKYERYTLEDFAKTVIKQNPHELSDILKLIHRLVVPTKSEPELLHKSLLTLLAKSMQEASSHICNTQQSPQQLLYNLYKTIAVTELKGFAMMQFSYALLKLYNLGNFTEEMEQLKQQYANRTSDTLRAVKTAMAFAPREVWKCDPSKHIEDKTYTQLKQVFQGYVVNEVDLNSHGTCKENCGYYSYSKVYGCFKNNYCAQQRTCNGKVLNCQYIDSDMWICPSDKSSSRRYEYIEYEDGKLFGQKGTCSRGTTKVDSWWRWLFWHCSYCMCYCDDHNVLSDRYFNLRDVTADVENNKVVTGVRMKKENQIIHIQIQQGVLLPRGNIDEKTIGWKPIENYTILDHNVRSGIDYHTIMWEKRAIDLDDLDAPEGHLLTGLRFRLVGSHLNLEIQMTPFNFSTGKLIQDKSQWHSNDNTDAGEVYDLNGETFLAKKRTELNINKPDIPTRSKVQSAPDSQSNQYLHFAPTDLEKDAAQTTIPFIDIQPIEPNPPAPISGAGIYHKGREGFGGFIGLKLFTFNIEPQLQADLPPNPPPVVNIGLSNEINEM